MMEQMKNQTTGPTFLKRDNGKICLIPDIIQYSLAKSLKTRGYIWFLIDLFASINRSFFCTELEKNIGDLIF